MGFVSMSIRPYSQQSTVSWMKCNNVEGLQGQGLLFYVKGCTIAEVYEWLTTFLADLHVVYQHGTTYIYEGKYHDYIETISLKSFEEDSFLEIAIASFPTHLPWKTDVDFARSGFCYFKREVRCIPVQPHYPGEYLIINEHGEQLVDWN